MFLVEALKGLTVAALKQPIRINKLDKEPFPFLRYLRPHLSASIFLPPGFLPVGSGHAR
jgi:hypothetical protein